MPTLREPFADLPDAQTRLLITWTTCLESQFAAFVRCSLSPSVTASPPRILSVDEHVAD